MRLAVVLGAGLAAMVGAAAQAEPLPAVSFAPHDCRNAPVSQTVVFEADYRPGVDDAADLGPLAVLAATITFQCALSADGGAFTPEGYRLDLAGPCPRGVCALGTVVATEEFSGKVFSGTMADRVGFREVELGMNKHSSLVLVVRTKTADRTKPVKAAYVLSPAGHRDGRKRVSKSGECPAAQPPAQSPAHSATSARAPAQAPPI